MDVQLYYYMSLKFRLTVKKSVPEYWLLMVSSYFINCMRKKKPTEFTKTLTVFYNLLCAFFIEITSVFSIYKCNSILWTKTPEEKNIYQYCIYFRVCSVCKEFHYLEVVYFMSFVPLPWMPWAVDSYNTIKIESEKNVNDFHWIWYSQIKRSYL